MGGEIKEDGGQGLSAEEQAASQRELTTSLGAPRLSEAIAHSIGEKVRSGSQPGDAVELEFNVLPLSPDGAETPELHAVQFPTGISIKLRGKVQ